MKGDVRANLDGTLSGECIDGDDPNLGSLDGVRTEGNETSYDFCRNGLLSILNQTGDSNAFDASVRTIACDDE